VNKHPSSEAYSVETFATSQRGTMMPEYTYTDEMGSGVSGSMLQLGSPVISLRKKVVLEMSSQEKRKDLSLLQT